jgi:putative transcriptional regulator
VLNPTDLLIAPPNIPDSRFKEAVIMLLSDNSSGSLGLVLNQPLNATTYDLHYDSQLGDQPKLALPLYWGGPVSPESVWMIHESGWTSENTMEVGRDVAVSSDQAMLDAIQIGEHPRSFRLFAGFASWAPGQLKAELLGRQPWSKKHSWLTTTCPDIDWLFECPVEELWNRATALCAQQAVNAWL